MTTLSHDLKSQIVTMVSANLMIHRVAHCFTVAIIAIMTAATLVACQSSEKPLTSKEQAFMNQYTEDMTPHCFGRYLIDLPVDMKVGKLSGAIFSIYPYSEYSGAIQVTVKPMIKAVFDSKVARRRESLEARHVPSHPEWKVLGDVLPLKDSHGVLLNWTDGMTRSTRKLELHGWKDNYAIEMTIEALDESFPENEDDPPELKSGADIHEKISMIQDLYARTRGRKNDEIPTSPGTCIQNGFISGPASDKMREDISMDFVSTSMPDVFVHMESDSGLRTDDSLLDRLSDIKKMLAAAHGEILRKGDGTSKAGLTFQEVLATGETPHDHVTGQYFTLEANSKIGSAQTPLLNIDFWNGNRETDDHAKSLAKASLTEGEATALWDKIIATLRKRPGGF